MPYEQRGGGLSGLVDQMVTDFERQVKYAVANIYCDDHDARPTVTIRDGLAGYTIDACCDHTARRAKAAVDALA